MAKTKANTKPSKLKKPKLIKRKNLTIDINSPFLTKVDDLTHVVSCPIQVENLTIKFPSDGTEVFLSFREEVNAGTIHIGEHALLIFDKKVTSEQFIIYSKSGDITFSDEVDVGAMYQYDLSEVGNRVSFKKDARIKGTLNVPKYTVIADGNLVVVGTLNANYLTVDSLVATGIVNVINDIHFRELIAESLIARAIYPIESSTKHTENTFPKTGLLNVNKCINAHSISCNRILAGTISVNRTMNVSYVSTAGLIKAENIVASQVSTLNNIRVVSLTARHAICVNLTADVVNVDAIDSSGTISARFLRSREIAANEASICDLHIMPHILYSFIFRVKKLQFLRLYGDLSTPKISLYFKRFLTSIGL